MTTFGFQGTTLPPLRENVPVRPTYRVPSKEERSQKLKTYALMSAFATALWFAITLSYVTPRLGASITRIAPMFTK